MKSTVATFVAISLLALGAIIFALFFRAVAGVRLYDLNFDAFHNSLTSEQGESIIHTSQGQLTLILLLLVATNFFWFGFGLFALSRFAKQIRAIN